MASVAPPVPAGGLRMEVACCDADHEGEWEGEWEECEVVADHGETCDVRIVEDGEVCRGVPRRLVRAMDGDGYPEVLEASDDDDDNGAGVGTKPARTPAARTALASTALATAPAAAPPAASGTPAAPTAPAVEAPPTVVMTALVRRSHRTLTQTLTYPSLRPSPDVALDSDLGSNRNAISKPHPNPHSNQVSPEGGSPQRAGPAQMPIPAGIDDLYRHEQVVLVRVRVRVS